MLAANPQLDPLLEAGDVVFIPQRPSTITVLGGVLQPGGYNTAGMKVAELSRRRGLAPFSDDDLTFIVLPDGSAPELRPRGLVTMPHTARAVHVVPRDLAPLTRQIILDITGIMSSLAVTVASLAILAKQ